jgi:hypothetical protein
MRFKWFKRHEGGLVLGACVASVKRGRLSPAPQTSSGVSVFAASPSPWLPVGSSDC